MKMCPLVSRPMAGHVQYVKDGNDLDAIESATQAAIDEPTRPSLIIVRTHIGYGSPNKQDTYGVARFAVGRRRSRRHEAKPRLAPSQPTFHIPEDVLAHFRKAIDRGRQDELDLAGTSHRIQRRTS
jgi:transketolase